MNLEVVRILNHGEHSEEYVELRATSACNLQNYMIAGSHHDTAITNKLRHVHWFYPKEVNAGDLIHLHSGKGSDISTTNVVGTTTHMIHWGLDHVIWEAGDTGVLFELKNWVPKKAD